MNRSCLLRPASLRPSRSARRLAVALFASMSGWIAANAGEFIAGAWGDEPQFHWLYARAVELDVPILLHPAKPVTADQAP